MGSRMKPAPKTFHVKSFGCQMNVYDGDRMAELMTADGLVPAADAAMADLVVLNTCHIRERATDKVYSDIGRLRKGGKDPMIAIAGCVAQAEGEEIMARAPADAVGVKLSTPRRGCSGLAYSVDYVSAANPMDEAIATPAGTLYVDAGSVLYLIGSRMDWVEDDFTAGFVFQNPNAKGACGCGESFTV